MKYKTLTNPNNEVSASLHPTTLYFTAKLILIAVFAASFAPAYAQVSPDEPPENASAKRYGTGWTCDRGYQEADGACNAIELPANTYATTSSYGRGWECNRGYRRSNESCIAILLPAHAYLNSARGDTWDCDRGFRKGATTCDVIKVPSNGYLSDSSYGPGWECERGYGADDGACVALQLPANAHLNQSGNDWDCNPPYLKRNSGCTLN